MTPKELVCAYCKEFSRRGWMPGASGAMALLSEITPHNRSILVTSNNLNRDALMMGDLFDLKLEFGTERIVAPTKLTNNEVPVLSDAAPLFLTIFQQRSDIKCVVDLTSEWFVLAAKLATRLWESKSEAFPDQLRVSNIDIIKNLDGHADCSSLTIPIVDYVGIDPATVVSNLIEVLATYPKTQGILLRDHGMLVFGKTPDRTKAHAEYFDFICRLALSENRFLD